MSCPQWVFRLTPYSATAASTPYAAAWLLRKEYQRTGSLWRSIGAYHSRTPHRRDAYIRRVKSNLERCAGTGFSRSPFLSGRQDNERSG